MKGIYGRYLAAAAFATMAATQAYALKTCTSDDTVFNATGSFDDNTTSLSGTLTIDTGCGTVVNSNLSVGPIDDTSVLFDVIQSSMSPTDGVWDLYLTPDSSQTDFANYNLTLDIELGPTSQTLVGYTGGALCAYSEGNCSEGSYGTTWEANGDPNLSQGSLSTSSAPEPSTVFLMALPAAWLGIRRWRPAFAAIRR